MDFTHKIILLSVLFIGVALMTNFLGVPHKVEEENNTIYLNKELNIKGWETQPIVSSDAVLDTLKANVTVFADYFQPKNKESVNLYIGYYDTLDKSKMSHAPQVCFTAQGWIMQTNDKFTIYLKNHPVKVNRLVLEKGTETLLVYYWYQVGADIYADLFRMKLVLAGQKLISGSDLAEGNAFVRVSTLTSGNLDATSRRLEGYVEKLYQELIDQFEHNF